MSDFIDLTGIGIPEGLITHIRGYIINSHGRHISVLLTQDQLDSISDDVKIREDGAIIDRAYGARMVVK